MSFFSAIGDAFSFVTDIVSNDDSNFITDILGAGVGFLTSERQIDANQAAAETMAAAERERAQIIAQAEADRTAAIRAGNLEAARQFQEIIDRSGAANQQLQRASAQDPSQLTPEQQRQLVEVRRGAQNQLASSGLRGAGRTVTAALRDVEGAFLSNAFDQNQARADSASRLLSGAGNLATGQTAALASDTGRAEGQGILGAGTVQGNAATNIALNDATAGIVNENIRGAAIGDIGSAITGLLKEQGRESRFPKQKPSEKDDEQTL